MRPCAKRSMTDEKYKRWLLGHYGQLATQSLLIFLSFFSLSFLIIHYLFTISEMRKWEKWELTGILVNFDFFFFIYS